MNIIVLKSSYPSLTHLSHVGSFCLLTNKHVDVVKVGRVDHAVGEQNNKKKGVGDLLLKAFIPERCEHHSFLT